MFFVYASFFPLFCILFQSVVDYSISVLPCSFSEFIFTIRTYVLYYVNRFQNASTFVFKIGSVLFLDILLDIWFFQLLLWSFVTSKLFATCTFIPRLWNLYKKPDFSFHIFNTAWCFQIVQIIFPISLLIPMNTFACEFFACSWLAPKELPKCLSFSISFSYRNNLSSLFSRDCR